MGLPKQKIDIRVATLLDLVKGDSTQRSVIPPHMNLTHHDYILDSATGAISQIITVPVLRS